MKKPSIERVGMDSGSACSSGAIRADAALDVAVSEEVPKNPWMVPEIPVMSGPRHHCSSKISEN